MMAGASANGDVEPLKLFVGGLSWETTKETLQNYFSEFGEVAESVIMFDNNTKKPRGFGFVTFMSEDSVTRALETPRLGHILDGKTIDPKRATNKGATNEKAYKVFIGGVQAGTTDDEIKRYFENYGTVKEVDMKKDQTSQRMRGFGFVEFADPSSVEKVVQIHFHQINNKTVEAKKAQPRTQTGSRNGSFTEQSYSAAGYPRGAYDASSYAGYPQYAASFPATYPPHAAQQQQQQAAAAAQYYGYGQNYPTTATYNQADQQRYITGQQGTATVPANQQIPPFTTAARAATGYTGTDSYNPSFSYQDGRAQAAQTSGYQQQQQQQQQQQHYDSQASNSYPRSMGQRSNYYSTF